jgi:hypothetical protein
MRPLTLDDLLPLDEFAGQRREYFESLNRYLNRYRRVRIGPRLTLRFENRQTLWFQVQDILRIARLGDPVRIQEELDLYNRLLPGRNQLQAALLVDVPAEGRLSDDCAFWQTLTGDELRLRIGDIHFPSTLVTCRPEDRCIGAAHWVQFALGADARCLLANFRKPALFEVVHEAYRHDSAPLSEDIRQSLLDDLVLSDRDEPAARAKA